MADDEDAVVACVLCFERTSKLNRKKTTRCVGEKLYLEKRETFGCYNSLLMSDLMNVVV